MARRPFGLAEASPPMGTRTDDPDVFKWKKGLAPAKRKSLFATRYSLLPIRFQPASLKQLPRASSRDSFAFVGRAASVMVQHAQPMSPSSDQREGKAYRQEKSEACSRARRGSKLCPLPTWWSLRGRCTRSHSEPGREMPQRQWYFVSRRGRVGRRQVCKWQSKTKSSQNDQAAIRPPDRPRKRPFCFDHNRARAAQAIPQKAPSPERIGKKTGKPGNAHK